AICQNEELTRVTIQRNKIHDPRYSANSWSDGHPAGPQGITFSYCGGQNVYRWNEIDGGSKHFNDGMGGEDNYSTTGWPNRDSDVYGNIVQNTWDDGLEIEGGNNNVRVWGNYVNNTGTGISSTLTTVGPLYIFRNVWNRNQFIAGTPGYDQAARIANFNDHFNGAAPDVGAAEAGDAAMKFGVQGISAVGSSSGGAPPPPSGGTGGTGSITGGMDSSSYTITAGQSVTFTATISGSSGTPTGSVTFRGGGLT